MVSLQVRPAAARRRRSSCCSHRCRRWRTIVAHPEGEAMPRLDDTAVEEGLQHLPGWERRGHQIVKTFTRADFAHAMVFVDEVAAAAEAAGHHPDIDIRWNTITLALSSHAEGGLTDRCAWRCRGWRRSWRPCVSQSGSSRATSTLARRGWSVALTPAERLVPL